MDYKLLFRYVTIVFIGVICCMLIEIGRLHHCLDNYTERNSELATQNQKYIDQQTPLQKAMNGLPIDDSERNTYLDYVWKNYSKYYD